LTVMTLCDVPVVFPQKCLCVIVLHISIDVFLFVVFATVFSHTKAQRQMRWAFVLDSFLDYGVG
jgi:hypothetical protein